MDKHNIRKGKEIEFGDGEARWIYPLSLKQLRKFVKVIEKMNQDKDTLELSDEDIDLMTEAAGIILSKVDKDIANAEWIDENVDIVIFRSLMEVAMGAASPNE